MFQYLVERTVVSSQIVNQNTDLATFPIFGTDNLAVDAAITVSTPTSQGFTSANVIIGSDTITITNHGFSTGLLVTLTTAGVLPTGLAVATNYFVISVDANTIALASSLANANAGTRIDLTGAGSGSSTVVPTALASANIRLQKSYNGTRWYDEGASQNITVSGNFNFEKDRPAGKFYRLQIQLASGQVTVTQFVLGKGEVF